MSTQNTPHAGDALATEPDDLHRKLGREVPASGFVVEMISATFGALLAWGAVCQCYPPFVVPDELRLKSPNEPPEVGARFEAAQRKVDRSNTTVFLGLCGGLVGGSLAVGEGIARRSVSTAILAGLGCGIAGVVSGSLAGVVESGCFEYLGLSDPKSDATLADTIKAQVFTLAVLGGGIGLALGCTLRRVRMAAVCLAAGVLAGALAGVLCPLAMAWLLPVQKTEVMVPQRANGQLLWIGLTAVLLGVLIPGTARTRPSDKTAAHPGRALSA